MNSSSVVVLFTVCLKIYKPANVSHIMYINHTIKQSSQFQQEQLKIS